VSFATAFAAAGDNGLKVPLLAFAAEGFAVAGCFAAPLFAASFRGTALVCGVFASLRGGLALVVPVCICAWGRAIAIPLSRTHIPKIFSRETIL